MDVLIDHEEMKLAQIQKIKLSVKDLKDKIASENKAIALLEASVTKVFTSLASGKITKEAFLHKKDIINDTVARKRSQIEKWNETLYMLMEGRSEVENAIADLRATQTLESLSRKVVDHFIDKILVHSESDIEIVWQGGFNVQQNVDENNLEN